MQRTQIYLEPELAESLDRLAVERGMSRAAVIRTAARQFVDREEARFGSILELAGIGSDTATDVAERHDDYLIQHEMEGWHR